MGHPEQPKESGLTMPEKLPTLETERLILRSVDSGDAKDVFNYASRPEVSQYMPWEPHKTVEETRTWLIEERAKLSAGSVVCAIELKETGTVIGVIDLLVNLDNRLADLGYTISPDCQRKGYGTEAAEAIVRYGFTDLGLNRIGAGCDVPNEASWKLMERLGMQYEGTRRQDHYFKGAYRDSKYYGLLRADWEAAQD